MLKRLLANLREDYRPRNRPAHLHAMICATLSGASDDTSFASMKALSARYPFIEWGILFSLDRMGREPRYPSKAWIEALLDADAECSMRLSLHLCGASVDQFIAGEPYVTSLVSHFDRIQVNFNQTRTPKDIALLAARMSTLSIPVITQDHPSNHALTHGLRGANHHVLFDASGGRGVATAYWPSYLPQKAACGYAGGLRSSTIGSALPGILASAGDRPFWVDLEQGLRDDQDRFSISEAGRFLEALIAPPAG